MSEPVDRLHELLARVQENRQAPRAVAEPRPAAAKAAAAAPFVSARQPMRPAMEEHIPQARSLPAKPVAAPTAQAPLAPAPSRSQPAVVPDRRLSRERLSTPLELAVEDELRKGPSEPPTSQFSLGKEGRAELDLADRAPRAGIGGDAPDFVIEPAPMREPNRPIAQTVSKHATEVDMTFGAMLRRSLSLRPR